MCLKNRVVCFVMVSSLFSFVSVAESKARIEGSERGAWLAADAVTRGYAGPTGDLYRIDVPGAAVITLGVMTPAVEENAITMLWEGTEPLDAVYRSATRWVVEDKLQAGSQTTLVFRSLDFTVELADEIFRQAWLER